MCAGDRGSYGPKWAMVLDEPDSKHGSEVADRLVMTTAEQCSDLEEERSGEAGRSDSAGAFAAGENRRSGCTLIAPRFQKCLLVNHSKEWRGRRDSNPRPLP